MKQFLPKWYNKLKLYLYALILLTLSFSACRKSGEGIPDFPDAASNYSADVIDTWITIQLRLMRDATGIPNNAFSRPYAYSGIAAWESLAPGIGESALILHWNGLSGLPTAEKHKKYYLPANVNAALAAANRNMFPKASAGDKAAIDSLEAAWNTKFNLSIDASVLSRSASFGQAVAAAVFSWSETDGYKNASAAYTPPVAPGLWVPTPPAFAAASTPYWGNNRPIIAGSGDGAQPGAPITYSETPGSPFYLMVKQVYDVSQTLTTDQKNMALFWRDIPGVTSPGHWLSILQQVLKNTNTHLDKAAFSYALTGTCANDAIISCWHTKYTYNLVRPITYIRNVLGFTTWVGVLTTPAHPEYSSAHAVLSAAAADAFTFLFGHPGSFTDHTYDYLGFPARTYASYRDIGIDAGNSRLYAGIHYQPSIDAGLTQGRKIAWNILSGLGGGDDHSAEK